MTKKEMARKIAEQSGISQLLALEVVQMVFDGITETLAGEGRIELRNFGVFEVKRRRARQARNPRTGETISVPERSVITFKPGREMEASVPHTSSRCSSSANKSAAASSRLGQRREL